MFTVRLRIFTDTHDCRYQELCLPNRTHMDGFATVGKGNKKITPGYLWQRWCEGQDRGIYEEKKEGS